MPKILDVIQTTEALPEHGLAAGAKGVVLEVFDQPTLAYEVEFCNDDGETLVIVTLQANQIELSDQK